MIVRTAPVVLPAPDAMRAMERLESQLRRAADDLAETLSEMREATAATLVVMPDPEGYRSRCGKWMPNSRAWCGRLADHRRECRSVAAMESERLMKKTARTA